MPALIGGAEESSPIAIQTVGYELTKPPRLIFLGNFLSAMYVWCSTTLVSPVGGSGLGVPLLSTNCLYPTERHLCCPSIVLAVPS